MRKRPTKIRGLVILLVCLVLVIGVYYLPPVHTRLARRVNSVWSSIRFFFNPPGQAVFLPTQQYSAEWMATQVAETMQALPSAVPTDVGTPTNPSTPIPGTVTLPGVVYVDQYNRWNYCGPANLTMALKFWGWTGNRDDVAAVVRPGRDDPGIDFISRGETDLNVMPSELVDFVDQHTDFHALLRYGGDPDLLKRLIAAGFPMVIEKGYFAHDTVGKYSWMGHYEFVTGYDDAGKTFLVQDAYEFGPNLPVKYDEFSQGWRAFDYLFFVVYPPERESDLQRLLGEWSDPAWADRHALDVAMHEAQSLAGVDQFFAAFNVGTNHINLEQYSEAASAYDYAFQLYAGLSGDAASRPYRLMWYEIGPYPAYFNTGRYQDMVNLANVTLAAPRTGPTLEESLYWRGMAENALGQTDKAVQDMRSALYYHPGYQPALDALKQWGATP
jgi:tetratricopeptide (TPR) repeat protein